MRLSTLAALLTLPFTIRPGTSPAAVARRAMALLAGTSGPMTETANARLQGIAPSENPVHPAGCSDRREPDALLGFYPSRDFTRTPRPTVHAGPLPWAWPLGPYADRGQRLVQNHRPPKPSNARAVPASLEVSRPS
jgi:hypothetical protein